MPLARSVPLTLGADGTARTNVVVDEPISEPTLMAVEMDYADANGETLTSSRRITLYPSAVRLGLKTDGWLMRDDDLRLKFVAIALEGQPIPGQRIDATPYNRSGESPVGNAGVSLCKYRWSPSHST